MYKTYIQPANRYPHLSVLCCMAMSEGDSIIESGILFKQWNQKWELWKNVILQEWFPKAALPIPKFLKVPYCGYTLLMLLLLLLLLSLLCQFCFFHKHYKTSACSWSHEHGSKKPSRLQEDFIPMTFQKPDWGTDHELFGDWQGKG